MFCKHCGAQIPDDVKFCTSCGTKLDATVQPVKTAAQTKGKALIAPAILAILSMLYMCYAFGNLGIIMFKYDIFNVSIFGTLFGDILLIVAALFVFLYCIAQAPKGKVSLFGIACLLIALQLVLSIASALIQPLLMRAHVRASAAGASVYAGIVNWSLDLAVIVLLVIEAVGAFKGRINKPVAIVAACIMILGNLVSSTMSLQTVVGVISFVFVLLLPVAILLIGILAKKK